MFAFIFKVSKYYSFITLKVDLQKTYITDTSKFILEKFESIHHVADITNISVQHRNLECNGIEI